MSDSIRFINNESVLKSRRDKKRSMKKNIGLFLILIFLSGCFGSSIAYLGPASTSAASGNLARRKQTFDKCLRSQSCAKDCTVWISRRAFKLSTQSSFEKSASMLLRELRRHVLNGGAGEHRVPEGLRGLHRLIVIHLRREPLSTEPKVAIVSEF